MNTNSFTDNPFFKKWNERSMPPFDEIHLADYEPAIMRGIDLHNKEIDSIVNQEDEPTFENTIVALERSGSLLNKVLNIFYPMLSACADDALMKLATKLAPVISTHSTSIMLNQKLWNRIQHVCETFDNEAHDREDFMLLKKTCEAFERNGANLEEGNREKFRELSRHLSELTLKFEQNHLKEMARIEMWLGKDDLDGLPEITVESAAKAAADRGRDGEYLITLQAPSYVPFMKYSSKRHLREKLYMLYNTQCTSGENSNIILVKEIANTRLELAQLLGYSTFANYRLQYSMAKSPESVYNMLDKLREAYSPLASKEIAALTEFASKYEGHPITLKPWDYSYYANKEKESLYNVNDELLRPYFSLESVIDGIFGLATRLYGLRFNEISDVPVFDPEVKVYEVTDNYGEYLGVIYTDFFPRETKQSGAWMTNFGEQYVDADGCDIRPLVSLTMNFTRPTPSKPSLLTYKEVNTFLHEFGHGLHSLLSRCKYVSTSGTNVYRDFVEMPSQFHENYLRQREFLDSFARHYETGELIPQEYIDNIIASSRYGAGYACLRQLSFGLLDMAWHTISAPYDGDICSKEFDSMSPVRVFDPIDGCLMSPQFGHIFSGGYASGYYGYKWAEMLDADAFAYMEEKGIFDSETAKSLVDNILSRGSSDEAMALYKAFLGREPSIDALLHRDGVI